jgi:uncharacterized protein (DUF1499 family)
MSSHVLGALASIALSITPPLVASTAFAPPATAAAQSLQRNAPPPTPYQRGLQLTYGLDAGERIRRCDAAANPNCVSSRVTSAVSDLFSPPWVSSSELSPLTALNEFDATLRVLAPGTTLLDEQQTSTGGLYRRYKLPDPAFGFDVLEVLLMQDGPSLRLQYRSQTGTVKYVWPITQPVSDLGAQRRRMQALRERLSGWRIAGGDCDVVECYRE